MNEFIAENICSRCSHMEEGGNCTQYGQGVAISFDHKLPSCNHFEEKRIDGAVMCMNEDCLVDPIHSSTNEGTIVAEWNERPLEMAYLVEALALGEALYRVLHFLETGAGDKDAIAEDIRKTLDIGNAGR